MTLTTWVGSLAETPYGWPWLAGWGREPAGRRTLLCLVNAIEEPEQLPGKVPLEAASNVSSGLPFCGATSDVIACGLVVAAASEDDDVESRVELAVAAAIEPMTDGLSGGSGDRSDPGQGGKGGLIGQASGMRPSDQDLSCTEGADAGLGAQAGCELLNQTLDLALVSIGPGGQIPDEMRQVVHGDQASPVLAAQTRAAASGQALTDQALSAVGTQAGVQEASANGLRSGDHQLREVVSQPSPVAHQFLSCGQHDAQLFAFLSASGRVEALHGKRITGGADGVDLIRLATLARRALGPVDLGHGLSFRQQVRSQRGAVRAGALNRPEQRSGIPRGQSHELAMTAGVGSDFEQFEAAAAGVDRRGSQTQLVRVDTDDMDELLCQDGHGCLLQGDREVSVWGPTWWRSCEGSRRSADKLLIKTTGGPGRHQRRTWWTCPTRWHAPAAVEGPGSRQVAAGMNTCSQEGPRRGEIDWLSD